MICYLSGRGQLDKGQKRCNIQFEWHTTYPPEQDGIILIMEEVLGFWFKDWGCQRIAKSEEEGENRVLTSPAEDDGDL